MNDPYDLRRFVDAQEPVFGEVITELREGFKQGHWMWFIFPQISGLGHSEMARRFAISSRAEAEAYLQHAILGPRLRECARIVDGLQDRTALQVFGPIDALKLHSSMTLFALVAEDRGVFREVLTKYFAGEFDSRTVAGLGL